MKSLQLPSGLLTDEERLCLAQEAYREYSCQCFWFMDRDLIVTEDSLPLIIEGLKLHGGHKGWKLAHALSARETPVIFPERPTHTVYHFFPMVDDELLARIFHEFFIDSFTSV